MAPDSLSITDNRTGSQYELPIADGAVRAADLRQIKTSKDDFGSSATTLPCLTRPPFGVP